MIPLDLGAVAAVVGGRLVDADPTAVVSGGVGVDSRTTGPGDLFFCLAGERVDGHAFAAAAIERGAVAVVAAHEVGVPAIVVADPLAALGVLANAVLGRLSDCRVAGITGSTGKTSTKDLLAQLLEPVGPVIAPANSFNNEVGLPLTVLRVDERTRVLVAEYSARGVGHIRYLCSIAPPTIGVVLNVGAAHLGAFGSREAIALAKGELVEALPPPGTAVLNADDPLVAAMSSRTEASVVTFGRARTADVRLTSVEVDAEARPSLQLETPVGPVRATLQLHGAHHAGNAAAAVAAGLALGLDADQLAAGLERAVARSPHRMAVTHRADGLVVIDDSYNANPESMRAAIDALQSLAGGRRTWAVLGEMRELGDESAAMHADIARYAAGAGVTELVAVAADGYLADLPAGPGRARGVADTAAAEQLLADEVRSDDVVLVKASNSVQLWHLAEAIVGGRTKAATT